MVESMNYEFDKEKRATFIKNKISRERRVSTRKVLERGDDDLKDMLGITS